MIASVGPLDAVTGRDTVTKIATRKTTVCVLGLLLGLLAGLKAPVDAFFDGVEVLARENRELMHNRVGILRRLSETLNRVADFSTFAL